MSRRLWPAIAAAGMMAFTTAALAQTQPNESAQQNVRESEQYQQLVCSNAAFRAKRIAQECGPLDDPQLHAQCLASFNCATPERKPNWRQAPPSETIR